MGFFGYSCVSRSDRRATEPVGLVLAIKRNETSSARRRGFFVHVATFAFDERLLLRRLNDAGPR